MALALIGGLLAPVAAFAEPTTDGDRAADGLLSLARALDALGSEPMLGTPLPMTLHSPAGLLGFPTVFGQKMSGLASGSFADVAAVASALSGTTTFAGTSVGSSGPPWTITIPVNHTVTQDVPIVHFEDVDETDPSSASGVSLIGGPVQNVTASLTGQLVVTFDPAAVGADGTTFDPQHAVALDQASSSLTVTVTADDAVDFSSVFGLTEVAVTGNVIAALTTPVAFVDPDGSGRITREEWETALLADLTTVTDDDTTDDLTVALKLDSDLVDGTSDGTMGYAGNVVDWVPADGSFEPDYTPDISTGDHLGDFLNVTVEDALASLAQYATAAQALQSRIDVPMPFTSYRLRDAYSPADEIMEVLERQAAAAVACGKVPTSPPSGADLAGKTWYCQAFSTQDPSAVTWSVTGAYTIDETTVAHTSTDTVGVSPTAMIEIDATGTEDGSTPPDVSVEFTITDEDTSANVQLTADRRFRSAQELEDALVDIGTPTLTYDETDESLIWDLDLSHDPATPTAANAAFDIGDLLRTPTHLSGVEAPTSTAVAPAVGEPIPAVKIDVGTVAYSAGFGLLMHAPVTDEVRGERYFFVGNGTDPVLSVGTVTGTMPAAQTLTGRIGFVDVDVTPETSFSIGANTGDSGDAMAVAVDTVSDTLTITDAITFGDLLTDPTSTTTPTFNIASDISLDVEPSGTLDLGVSTEDLSIDVAWGDYPTTGAVVTMSSGYEDLLYPLDIAPTLEGVYTGDADGVEVDTSGLDLTTAFGEPYAAGDVVDTTLFNLTSGATCVGVEIVDSDTFACADADDTVDPDVSGLFGSQRLSDPTDETSAPDNLWQDGDRWLIQGDPDALRTVVLDAVFDLANRLDLHEQATTPVYRFPLIGLAPRDLDPRFSTVADAVNAIRALPDDPEPTEDEPTPEAAPNSLQELETDLLAALNGISPDDDAASLTLGLDPIDSPADSSALSATHLTVEAALGVTDATVEAPVRIDLGDDSDLGAAAGMKLSRDAADVTATLPVTYSKGIAVDVAIPVDPTVPLRHVLALSTAGVSSMSLSAGSDDVSFPASLGPLEVIAGTGATLTGSHVVPTGTHTATSPLASGTHTAARGTAGEGTTANIVKSDPGALSVGDTVQRTGDSQTCTVSLIGTDQFTCDATADWAKDDAWLATAMAELVTAPDLTGHEGDVFVRDADGVCRIGSDESLCDLGSAHPWVDGDTWKLLEGTVLTDDAADPKFDEMLTDLGLLLRPTITVNRRDTGTLTGTCQADSAATLTATTLECGGLVEGTEPSGWQTDDAYELIVGDPTTTLYDPGVDFHQLSVEGATVRNVNDGSECVVQNATGDALICVAALTGGTANTWQAGDVYEISGVGEARIEVGSYTLTGLTTDVIPAYVDGAAASVSGATAPTCGAGVSARTDDACAILSLMVPGDATAEPPVPDRYLGQLSWQYNLASGIPTASGDDPFVSPQITDALTGEEPLRFTLLSAAFQALEDVVAGGLEGTLINEPLPLVGLDVSAGARLLEAIDLAEQQVAGLVPETLTTETDLAQVETDIETWLNGALTDVTDGTDVLVDAIQDVDVTLYCGAPTVCVPADDAPSDVDDVTVAFVLGNYLQEGQTTPGTDCANCVTSTVELAYDAGLDGLPLDVRADLESRVGWSLPVTIGISRDLGPYLDVSGDDFELDALVRFPDPVTPDCPTLPLADANSTNVGATGFSSTRCAVANIGLFQGTVWDGDGAIDDAADPDSTVKGDEDDSDRSQLRLQTKLDLSQLGTDDRISAGSVIAGETPTAAFNIDADANIDLYFRTGVQLSETIDSEGLPSVQGAFHLTYEMTGGVMLGVDSENTAYLGVDGEEILVDRLILDAGSFFKEFVTPIAAKISTYTKPFKPIIDILNTPIPVISDVSQWTGNGVVRPIDVLREATGAKLELLERVLGIIVFADQVATLSEQGYISLGPDDNASDDIEVTIDSVLVKVPNDTGKFAVGAKGRRTGDCGGKNPDGSLKSKNCKTKYSKGGTSGTTTVKQLSKCGSSGNAPCTGKEMTRTVSTRVNKPQFVPGGLTFPFMDDATQVFGMIMGTEDATLVRFDAGQLVASAGLSVSFGPFMAGPVPIDITVGAIFSIHGRFAMGYDTRGITTLLKQDPADFDPAALLGGIFIDDLDAAGFDVPEITVAVTATLAASVSVKIFKVGLEGGVTLAIEFNLNDPDSDGKLRHAEIRGLAAENPMCIFEVRGTLGFFLGFFVEIDIKIKTLRWSKTLFSAGPFTLFEVKCEPEPPALATPATADTSTAFAGTSGDLRLNIGETHVTHRNYAEDESKEKYVVRQLTAEGAGPDSGTKVSVEGFGLYQEFTVGAGGHIWGEAGNNHDNLRFEPGSTGKDEDDDGEVDVIPFTLDVRVDGGAGNDKITTGGGHDRIAGGAGNDTIQAGLGNDVVDGDAGTDNLAGGPGNDALDGGADDDLVSGEQGSDVVAGGAGDDDLGGGPGLAPDVFQSLVDLGRVKNTDEARLTDGDDVLWGGDGNDRLRGHVGADVLFGDELLGFGTAPTSAEALRDGALSGFTSAPLAMAGFAHAATTADVSGACGTDGAGTGGNDTLSGEAGDDLLFGGGGNDDVTGGADDDLVCGNGGRDVVDGDASSGSSGDDAVDGGAGNDRAFGRGGNDQVRGGAGDDLADGAAGNDRVFGDSGTDAVIGGPGNDVAMGDSGTVTSTVDGSFAGGPAAFTSGIQPDGDAGGAGDAPVAPMACDDRARIRGGLVDVDGDGDIDGADDGSFAGYAVIDGELDVDGDGAIDADDAGVLADVGILSGRLQQSTDTILPGPVVGVGGGDADCVLGQAGNDLLFGNAGNDVVLAGVGEDLVDGNAGSDWLRGAQGPDTIYGGAGADTILGDSGPDTLRGGMVDLSTSGATDGQDTIDAGPGDDDVAGDGDDDTIRGGPGNDALVGGSGEAGAADGGDTIDGGTGDDLIAGDNATVVYTAATSGASTSLLVGAQGAHHGPVSLGFILLDIPRDGAAADDGGGDDIDGGPGSDEIHGQQFVDTIHGGRQPDLISGGSHGDVLYGDDANDRIIGGSSTSYDTTGSVIEDLSGVLDDGDTISGGTGDDLITGDNARIAGDGTITFYDVYLSGATPDGDLSGDDVIDGDTGDDVIRGQGGDDEIHGSEGTDDLEGNSDDDDLFGEEGADVLIGGSRQSGVLDGDDDIDGGEAGDLVLGDNADVTGTHADVRARAVVLHDVPTPGGPGGDTAGDDVIYGGDRGTSTGVDETDRIYGQADDDTIHGQAGDDDLQGNAGVDRIYGEDGADRIVGGSATDQSGTAGADKAFSDVADDGDHLYGGSGVDRILGDNGVIAPDLTIALADVPYLTLDPAPHPNVAGADTIFGDARPNDTADRSTGTGAEDVIRGQSHGDTIHGQAGDDDIEGNAGADTIFGDDGEDDIVGGSRVPGVNDDGADGTDVGDTIAGGAGSDWIAGDNASLVRGSGSLRTIELLDLAVASASQPDERASGGDRIRGDRAASDDLSSVDAPDAADVIYGQSGNDVIDAQAGDDTVDGNTGADTIDGGSGDDALVGGSSADDGEGALVNGGPAAVIPGAGPGVGRRLLTGTTDASVGDPAVGDRITGSDGVDIILGDNGVVDGHGTDATWRLHDVDVAGDSAEVPVGVAGPDTLSGNAGTDVIVGGSDADTISGGDGDDSLHGGPGADLMVGDAGADDLVGGSSHHWTDDGPATALRTVLDGGDALFGDAPTGDCLSDQTTVLDDCTDTAVNPSTGNDHGDAVIGDNGRISRDGDTDARAGRPTDDINTGDPLRSVLLYDVNLAGQPAFHDDANGIDLLVGAAGRDLLLGQADGDTLLGNTGDDVIEGNDGNDLLVGSVGSDDLLGGSSSDPDGNVHGGAFPGDGSGVADGDDRLFGDADADVALGDNGLILRPVGSTWTRHLEPYLHVIRQTVEVSTTAFEPAGAFGDDEIQGGTGHDDLRGQLGSDELHGGDGDDTLLGDLGHLLEHGVIAPGDPRTGPVTLPADALNEPIFRVGSLYREVELYETQDRDPQVSSSAGTGDDRLLGGRGNDVLFGGSGTDVLYGYVDLPDDGSGLRAGNDFTTVAALDADCYDQDGAPGDWLSCDEDDLFGGHGDDDAWGGPGHDRLFGGHNADDLDVIRADPVTGDPMGNPDVDYVGIDLIFGGWGQDTMQADVSLNGPDPGDRLIDAAGAYNAYFVCDGGYGDSTAMRRLDPDRISFLEQVAIGAGATKADDPGRSGWWELANIYTKDVKHNTSPVHPENPGNFVCNNQPAE